MYDQISVDRAATVKEVRDDLRGRGFVPIAATKLDVLVCRQHAGVFLCMGALSTAQPVRIPWVVDVVQRD